MTRSSRTARADIGIIGGSGLYDIEGLHQIKQVRIRTPFGSPSDVVVLGDLDGAQVAFLSRHGRGHRFNPSEINYRANIFALKSLGVRRVISVSAVGSLKESLKPGDVVLPMARAIHAGCSLGPIFERIDGQLRQWPTATLSLVVIALAMAASIMLGR